MIIIQLLGIVTGWFILGAIINYVIYYGAPSHTLGKSPTAKGLHIILNIITIIAILACLFS